MDPDHTLLFLNLFRLEKTLKQHSGRHWTQKCFRPNALLFLSECSWDNREWTTVCWCLCHIPQTTTSYHAVKSMSWRRRKKEKKKKKSEVSEMTRSKPLLRATTLKMYGNVCGKTLKGKKGGEGVWCLQTQYLQRFKEEREGGRCCLIYVLITSKFNLWEAIQRSNDKGSPL